MTPRVYRAVSIVLLSAVVAVFLFGTGRFVVLGISYALADREPRSASARTELENWWGPRELPHRGDDFLTVLERRGTLEAANEMVGALLLRHLRLDGRGSQLVITTDLASMSTQFMELRLERADGSVVVKQVQVFDEERLRRVSPLPVTAVPYDPALTEEELDRLPSDHMYAEYPFGWAKLYTPSPDARDVFVLHTTPTREGILIVPLEFSPISDLW